MPSQEYMDKMDASKNYANMWHADLMSTMQVDLPCYMSCNGRCGESKCPEFFLCTEVLLCFGNSVASTLFLLQDQFNVQTTPCDNCIFTQHKIEMDKRDGKFGTPEQMAVPPPQQMSRIDQAVPPQAGYAAPFPGQPTHPPQDI